MKDLLAVQPLRFATRESVKRALILYSRVFVPDLGISHAFVDEDPSLRADLDWLREKGRVISLEDLTPDELARYDTQPKEYIGSLATQLVTLAEGKSRPRDRPLPHSREDLSFSFSLYLARFFAIYMNPVSRSKDSLPEFEERRKRAYPELSQITDVATSYKVANELGVAYPKLFSLLAQPEKAEGVVRVIIDNIPVPHESTPFEQILDFVSDRDSRGQLAGVRRWIWDAVHSNLSVREIEDKLEHELYLFERHMDLHRMQRRTGTFETLVVTSAEILENLLRLKVGALAKGVLSIRSSDLALMQAELTAPGRELAYLYHARRTFGG